ncbi:ABC transporter permease subunit [Clostridium sp. UBA1056]|uniref:ABC transporter permease n=1 Tax=unclassified Clostridium TaxID=2614128 RepID=UPI0032165E78
MINNKKRKKIIGGLMILPSLSVIIIITMFVIINTFMESLGYIPELSFNNFTFKYYRELFADSVFLNSLYYSFKISLISAIIATVLGSYLGYYISKSNNKFLNILYRLPILLSYVAAAALIYTTYSDKGLLFHIISLLGFNEIDINLIFNSSGIAVILLNIFKGMPFIAFSVAPIFMKADKNYRFVAQNLGSTRFQYIIKILLPIAKRAIFTSFLVIFNFNMFTYEGFYYLGPSNPISIGVYAYKTYVSADLSNRIYGMAINMIMILISLVLCVFYYKMIKKDGQEEVR